MSADAGERSIEGIVQLVLDGREDEAHAAIGLDFGEAAAQELEFFKTPVQRRGAKRDGKEKLGRGKRDRIRLTNLYELSVFLSKGLGQGPHGSRSGHQVFGRYGRRLLPW